MSVKEKFDGDVAIISVSGNLMGGPETTAVHDKVREIVGKGHKKLVIDLGGVKWINSSGLGVLMGSMTTMKSAEGDMKLANVSDRIQSLFMITKLITIFETYESTDKAVGSFMK
ncbi:MAG: STAS domain-containing protein [Gemmatimonadota bacterium]|nr:MAG: STAS domain-containing protein [Gemmatimonadota bacterium]